MILSRSRSLPHPIDLRRAAALVGLLFVFVVSKAEAAYIQRFNTITNGAITFTGNTMGLSKVAGGNAQGDQGSIGSFITTDTSKQDLLPAPPTGSTPYPFGTTSDWTQNASSAVLSVPAGSTVLYAELIWGGSYAYGGENVSGSLNTPVKFTVPGGGTQTISPDAATSRTLGTNTASTCTSTNVPCFYVRTANVTSIITASGAGTYTVSGVPGTQGNSENSSNNAGWTLAVVYRNFSLPARNLTLFVGSELTNTAGSAQASVTGFCTPSSGVRSGRLLVSAQEGDPFGGDGMTFGPTATTRVAISGPNNPVNNFFASQINKDDGTLDTSGTFGTRNHNAATQTAGIGARQGWDITNVDVSSTLASGQTSAVAQGTTTSDQYVVNALALQINVGAPSFPTTTKTVDKANAVPGDTLTYTVVLDNSTGTADANNVQFTDPPPPGTSFVANSVTVDGVAQPGANPATGISIGTVTAGQKKTVTFRAQVNSVPSAPSSANYSNSASWTYDYISCAGQPVTNGSLTTNPAVTNAPRLEPTKTVSPAGTVRPNDLLTYTIQIPNTGLAATNSTTLQDSIPAGTTYVAGSTTLNNVPVTDLSGGVMPFTSARSVSSPARAAGQINPGETATVQFQVRVNASTTGPVTNTATTDIDGTGPLAAQPASVTSPVQPTADLSLTKTDAPDPVVRGNSLTYTIRVSNAGPSSAVGATVTDTLPAALGGATWTCVAGSGSSCPASGSGNISATVNLAPGASSAVVFTVTGTVSLSAPNPLLNTASVAAPAGVEDLDASNNTATASTTVVSPDLTISKAHSDPFTRGQGAAYQITVTNSGSSPTSAPVTVSDTLPTGLTPGGATGTGWSCTTSAQTVSCARSNASDTLAPGSSFPSITIPVTVEQSAAASLTNTASVSGGGDTNPSNNSASDPTQVVSSADLSLVKTGPASGSAGTSLSYTIRVTNNGPSDAAGVTVSDPTPSGLTFTGNTGDCTTAFPCNLGLVPSGATRVITATYAVPVGYTAPDPIQNTATVSSSTPDPAPGDNAATATTALGAPVTDLGITKTDEPAATTATPGSSISYKIVVTNAGPNPANGATVTDTLPAALTGATWTCAASAGSSCPATGSGSINAVVNVAVGGTLTFTLSGTIDPAATGSLVNTASVAPPAGSSDPTPNLATDSNTLTPQADLTVAKTGPGSVTPGTNATYTITVRNAGPSSAASVSLVDPTPAGLSFVSNSGACTTAFPCSLGTLPPGATRTVTATYSVPAGYTTPNPIQNTATVSSPTPDPQPGNTSTASSGVTPSADLSVTKTVDNPSPAIGENVTYTVTLENAGPSLSRAVSLRDTLPIGLSFVSANPSAGNYSPSTGLWTAGDVAPGAQSLQLVARVDLPGAITNRAEVSAASTPDPDSTPNDGAGDDAAAATLNARAPDLTATKAHTGTFLRGGTGSYSITVTNSGNAVTTAPVSLSDALPTGLTPVSASGTGWTCAVNAPAVSCTRSDPLAAGAAYPVITVNVNVEQTAAGGTGAGSLTNTASASGGGEFNTGNSSASDPTQVISSADLALVKTAPAQIMPGQSASFTLVVSNAGPSDAANVVVSDPPPTGLSFVSNAGDCTTTFPCSLGAIPAGASRSITVTYAVPNDYSSAALGPNPVVNTASLSSPTPDPDAGNNAASASAPVQPSADLVVSKTAPASLTPGTSASFVIRVENRGPSDAAGVTVSDPTPSGLSFVSNSGDCSTAFPCALGAIPAGASRSITATYSVPAGYTAPDPVQNTASASSPTPDPNPGNSTSTVSAPLSPRADLSLQKTVSDAAPNLGANITYTLTLVNAGPSVASNVTVSDALPGGLSFVSSTASLGSYSGGAWTIPSVPLGTHTLQIVATVTGSGAITNTATITASGTPDPDTSDLSASVALRPRVPDLTINKSHNGSFVRGTGNSYTLAITNSGDGTTIAPVTVSDTLPAGLTPGTATGTGWSCSTSAQTVSCARSNAADTLAPGSSFPSITLPVTVEQSAAGGTGAGSLTNTAGVSGGGEQNTANNSASDPTPIISSADLRLTKTGTPQVVAGNNVTYTVTVTNAGPSDAVGVTVTDPTPSGLNFVSNSGDCSSAYPCALGRLAPGATRTITTTYSVPATYTVPDPILNTASVSSSTPDPAPLSNAATAATTLNAPVADLSLTKTDSPPSPTAIPGAPITYVITVSNAGPSAADGARVTDALPTSILNATWTCAATGGSSCLGNLSGTGDIDATVRVLPGETVTFTLNGTVAPDAVGTLVNTASVKPPAGTADPTSNNNTDVNTLTPQANLSLQKSGPLSVAPGQTISYTLTVNNAGPSNAQAVSVDDPTPPGLIFIANSGACTGAFPCDLGVLAPNTTKTITATYRVPSDYTAPSPVQNSASVSSSTPDPTPGDNAQTSSANLGPSADLSVAKTVNNAAPVVGDTVTFTIALQNAGPSDAVGLQLRDALPGGLAYVSSNPSAGNYDPGTGLWSLARLAPGTARLEVVARVVGPGAITNTAEVIASGTPDPDSTPADGAGDDRSSVTLGAVAPDLSISKVHTGTFLRGGTGSYTITVTNSGSSATSAPVTVSDTLPVGLTPSSASGTGWTCTITGQDLSCSRSDALTAGSSFPAISLNVAVEQGAAGGTGTGNLTNVAGVSGGGDLNAGNNSASDPTQVASSADLSLQKTVDNPAPNLSDTIQYTVTLRNAGPSNALSVVTRDALPAGLQLLSSSASAGSYDSASGAWSIPSLPVGTATLTLTARVVSPGAITNIAEVVSSGTPDPDSTPGDGTGDDRASVPINATAPDLSVSKSHSGTFLRGGSGLYTITVTNSGSGATTAPVALNDTLPSGLVPASVTGIGWSCLTAAQTVSCSRSDSLPGGSSYPPVLVGVDVSQSAAGGSGAGSLTNTAGVSGGGEQNTGNNSASDPTGIASSADLAAVKTGPATLTPGLTVTYNLRVSNSGPSDAQNVTVSDPTPSGLGFVSTSGACTGAFPCNLGPIPAGETRTIQATYSVPADYVEAARGPDPVQNTASVSSDTPDPNPGNSSSTAFTPVASSADLQLAKLGPVSVTPGTNLTYTLTLRNAGPSDARNVSLSDPTPSGLQFVAASGACTGAFPCDLGTVPVGATRTVTVTYAIPATYTTPDPIQNTASVSSSTPDPNATNSSATATSSIGAPVADLGINKTDGTTIAVPGAPIQYTITVTNAGPSAASGARVVDRLPAAILGATWTCGATAGSSCSSSNGTGDIDTLVSVVPGGTVTFTLSGTVAPDAVGLLVNAAAVTPPAGTADPSSANNTDVNTLTPSADLSLAKTGPGALTPGGTVTYTLTVQNAGPSNAANVTLNDPTPAGLIFVGTSGDCRTPFPCALGTVPPGATRTVQATYSVPANLAAASVTNTASLSSPTPDPDPSNNSSVLTSSLAPSADLSLVKSVNRSNALPGEAVTFSITLTNSGPSDAVNVRVRERLPAGLAAGTILATLGAYDAATGIWTIGRLPDNQSATLTVNATVTRSGPITNTAEVVSSDTPDPDSTPGDARGDDIGSVTFGAPVANLSITKSNGTALSVPGTTVTYTIVARNAGPDSVFGANVTDNFPSSLGNVAWTCAASAGSSCPASGSGNIDARVDLGVNGSVTFTATGTISPAASGVLSNTARISAPSGINDPDQSDNSSTDADTLGAQADLEIVKTAAASANKGEEILYTLTVRNLGPSNAASVAVTDALPAGLRFVSAISSQGSCGFNAPNLRCDLGALAPGSQVQIGLRTIAANFGAITNTASVSSATADPNPGNDSGRVTTTVGTLSDLALTKTHTGTFVVGENGVYALRVSNLGTDADPGPFTVTDTLPVGLSFVSSGGADWTCAAAAQTVSCTHPGPLNAASSLNDLTLNVRVGPEAYPAVTNVASVSSPFGDANPGNNTARDATAVTAPVLALEKTAAQPVVEIGGTLAFTLRLRNNGAVPVSDLSLSDELPLGLVYQPGSSTLDGAGFTDPQITVRDNR